MEYESHNVIRLHWISPWLCAELRACAHKWPKTQSPGTAQALLALLLPYQRLCFGLVQEWTCFVNGIKRVAFPAQNLLDFVASSECDDQHFN